MTSPPLARPTHVRYYVLAALCVVTVVNYIQRNSIGGMETTIRHDLTLEPTDTGAAMAVFFWSYAVMQIPTGLLAKRWGPRTALPFFIVGWSLATASLALALGPFTLTAGRLAMGVFQAGVFPCATLIMVAWLPPARRALASGILNSCMLIGGAAVSNLTATLLAPAGPLTWRGLFLLYGLPGLLVAACFYYWFRDQPAEHRAVNAAELAVISAGQKLSKAKGGIPWAIVLLSLPLWLICVQQFFRAGANRFTDQWLSTYLQEVPLSELAEGPRKRLANHLASAPQYAGVVGGLIGGFISDWVLRRTGSRRAGRNGV
ncbi:MAG: MFS transporter, partial [Gemmataceae bacterium]